MMIGKRGHRLDEVFASIKLSKVAFKDLKEITLPSSRVSLARRGPLIPTLE